MTRRNWMPLYIPDFLADTVQLSAAETGAYLCLIMDYWLHDGLPDDDHKLAAIARVPLKAWRGMRPTIEAFFRPGWRHKRIDAELAKMVGTSIRRKEAASKAGTVSAIKRANGTSTQRVRSVHAASTSRARSVHHSTQEDITTTTRDTARARATPENSAANSTEPDAGVPHETPPSAPARGLGEEARSAVAASTKSIGSGELLASLQAKRWVP
jgi:uncharacterized protein YdaU (DUF1376 family)